MRVRSSPPPLTKQLKRMNRSESNLAILNLLFKIVYKHPELRFTQILSLLDLDKDKFHEESSVTLKNIENWVKNNL